MASKPEDGGGSDAGREVSPYTNTQRIASPDFDGEKVVVAAPPGTDDSAQNLPQPTATLVNEDPRSLPQVVGIEDEGNSPPQTWAANADPRSSPQAVGTKHEGNSDKGVATTTPTTTTTGKPATATEPARTMAIDGEDGGEEPASEDSKRRLKRKRMFFLIGGVVFLVIALAVGLSVGLTSRKSSSQ
jgi:hypothetical protein